MTSNLQRKYPALVRKYLVFIIALLTLHQAAWAIGDDGIEKSYVTVLAGSPLVSNSSPLLNNAQISLTYAAEFATSRKIKNIITLSIFEETPEYLPDNFTASVTANIDYGPSSSSYSTTSHTFTVSYSKAEGFKYDAKNYLSFDNAEFVRVTVQSIAAPVVGSFDTRKALILQNEQRVTRYFTLKNGVLPGAFNATTPVVGNDELTVDWIWPSDAGNTHTQLEWTWLENEMAPPVIDNELLFRNNATRVDLPAGITIYKIPLLYGGKGKLYCRIRAVNIKKSGSRTDGPWNTPAIRDFNGHNDDLNWQSTIIFSEEGKRKAVIQYFDGSLRSRQTVTKDNVTNTVATAETFYDAEGRQAVQILPTPGTSSVIGFSKNLNLFKANTQLNLPNDQALNEDPVKFFDLQPLATPTSVTAALNTVSGAANYYSAANPQANSGINAQIPDAEGFPYAVTRYTPDATGRVLSQSGAGAAMQMGKGHETKHFYGTPAQEELDGLFGTEVGNYTHYFKNMIKDANGQMTVNYIDMDDNVIATALAGDAVPGMLALSLNNTDYPNQSGTQITRNLLSKNSNIIKNNSIESVNSLLVPATTLYEFTYQLTPGKLDLTACSTAPICYDCLYDLEIAITDESGDAAPIVRRFSNVSLSPDDNCSTATPGFKAEGSSTVNNTVTFSETLLPGSYSVRKTLTVSSASLQTYKELYLTKGLCKTEQQLIDSVYTVLLSGSTCDDPPVANNCEECLAGVGTYLAFKSIYLLNLNLFEPLPPAVEAEIQLMYKKAQQRCDKLCSTTNGISQALPVKRSLMLADMMPFTGQYAKSSGSGTMWQTYDVFFTGKFRDPKNRNKLDDYYRDDAGLIDPVIHPDGTQATLDTTSKERFADIYEYAWGESMLPHHPEYDKLKYAEDNLINEYNWITAFSNTATYAEAQSKGYIFTSNANLNDPFYTKGTAFKADMATKVTSNYRNNLSLWQIAYGDVACKTIINPAQQNSCYRSAAKVPPYSLSTTQLNQVWALFRNLYALERDVHVNAYINTTVPLSNAQTLVDQSYILQFPTSNSQMAQQYGNNQQGNNDQNYWAWLPVSPNDPPNIGNLPGGTTPGQTYASRCSSYIEQWRRALLQCQALQAHPNSQQILNQIMAGMEAVCQKGSDEANPFGASSVAPATPNDGSARSFEQVINSALSQNGIAITNLCNPFVIEFPRPYGKGPKFIDDYITALDTCHCKRFTQIKNEAVAAGKNPAVLSSFNEYLTAAYGETLTASLLNALNEGCPSVGTTLCYDTTLVVTIPSGNTIPCECTLVSGNTYNCTKRICKEINPYPLSTPERMPQFLKCGATPAPKCITCAQISSLVSEFKTAIPAAYNAGPIFTGTDLTPDQIRDNTLFAQFVNYRTGYQYNWITYAKAAASASPACNLANYAGNGSATQNVICADTKPLTDTTGLLVEEPACQPVYNMAVALAQDVFLKRKETLLANFEAAYQAKCLSAGDIESFTVRYTTKEYHYTLYYYDQAGNLVKTVPPKGVRPDFGTQFLLEVKQARAANSSRTPAHQLVTDIRYNSLNLVVSKSTPDAGTFKYWYDKLGRSAITQDAQQALDNEYTYTVYDEQGRTIETGQKPQATPMTQVISQDPVALNNWITINGGVREQITFTVYDIAYSPVQGTYMTQQNLRNRISYTGIKNLASDNLHYTATFYTYDMHGNVEALLQDYKGIAEMDGSDNRFKLVTYDYDQISHKVTQVNYQPDKADGFYHRYKYDAENRLVEVWTSRDKIIWERDAAYNYYKHGPLARTELGQLRVQGLDYAYTLQGWMKGVNSTAVGNGAFDIGKDGLIGGPNANVARDIMGYSILYYDANVNGDLWRDYKPIAGANPFSRPFNGISYWSLYNGNISGISINNAGLAKGPAASTNSLPLFNTYRYDQLNRYRSKGAHQGFNNTTNEWNGSVIGDGSETVTYDPNGNIVTLARTGAASVGRPLNMDNLTYAYDANSNKLNHIQETVVATAYNDDIDAQSANNYLYDAAGNLRQDNGLGITSITWNVYGKVASIVKNGATILYTYDAGGHRLTKSANGKLTVYVRDATGNLMTIYEKAGSTTLKQTESYIYGSTRLGIATAHTSPPANINLGGGFGPAKAWSFTRAEKIYELTNHQGNVIVTINDKKTQFSGNGTTVDYYAVEVVSATEYMPFGSVMPGRSYTTATTYRYGYGDMEKDEDIDGTGNVYTTEFRLYDSRIGRWFSVDPDDDNTIDESPYASNHNNPIQLVDPKGDDPISGIVDALIAFGLSAGSDYVGALLEGKSHEDAVDEIGWWGAGWEGIKSYAKSVISPPGVGIAAKIYKFSQTKVGKVVAGTVERMIDKAIYNYEHGLYNDENGEFDFDKVSFKDLLLESFQEELTAEAQKVLKGKAMNSITGGQNGGIRPSVSTNVVSGGGSGGGGVPTPSKSVHANSKSSKKTFTIYKMEGEVKKTNKTVTLEYGKTSRKLAQREKEKIAQKYNNNNHSKYKNVRAVALMKVRGGTASSKAENNKVYDYRKKNGGNKPPMQGRPSGKTRK